MKAKLQQSSQIDRKQDARKKIMLGGLIIKAELDHLHPSDADTLYGMLLYSKQLMAFKPELVAKWKEMGKGLKNQNSYNNGNDTELKGKTNKHYRQTTLTGVAT